MQQITHIHHPCIPLYFVSLALNTHINATMLQHTVPTIDGLYQFSLQQTLLCTVSVSILQLNHSPIEKSWEDR